MNKKIIQLLLLGSLISLLGISLPTFAVDSLSIRDVEPGDNNVRVDYTKANRSDRYTIRLNGRTLESDRLDQSGDGSIRLPQKVVNREVYRAGDKIEVTVTSYSGHDYIREYTVRGNTNGNTYTWTNQNQSNQTYTPYTPPVRTGVINGFSVAISAPNDVERPTYSVSPTQPSKQVTVTDQSLASTLSADKTYLMTDSGKQSVTLTFNTGFVPKNGDFILALAVDKSGKRLKTEEFSIPTVANASLTIDVEPPLDTASYQFIFISGEASNKGNARVSIPVKDGRDQVFALEKNQAYVNTLNELKFNLKDKAGNITPLPFSPSEVTLLSTNHEGHTILLSDVYIDTSKLSLTGEGSIRFKTTEKGTLNLRLSAKDDKGNTYLSTTSTLSVTEDKRVILTIGSPKIQVGKKEKMVDASPEVRASRTFVPLRALVESFEGTSLRYTAKDKKITITQDDTTIILTLGSQNYQVGGLNKTMDVKPYVTSTKRTMVPVRVIAEALAYKVDFTKEGTSQKVIFEKEAKAATKVESNDLL